MGRSLSTFAQLVKPYGKTSRIVTQLLITHSLAVEQLTEILLSFRIVITFAQLFSMLVHKLLDSHYARHSASKKENVFACPFVLYEAN